jgi:hypothetical protein
LPDGFSSNQKTPIWENFVGLCIDLELKSMLLGTGLFTNHPFFSSSIDRTTFFAQMRILSDNKSVINLEKKLTLTKARSLTS